MFTSYLVCASVHASFYQINAKQLSAWNVAIEAAHTVVEQQYKIKDSAGQKVSAEEIQAIIKKQLDKEPWEWTTGMAHTDREVSTVFTLFIHPKLCPQSFHGPFLHPCIPAIIAKICYTKSGLCIGVSLMFSSLFNLTALPLIAFAAMMVCCYTASLHGFTNASSSPMQCWLHGGQVFIKIYSFLLLNIARYTMVASRCCDIWWFKINPSTLSSLVWLTGSACNYCVPYWMRY